MFSEVDDFTHHLVSFNRNNNSILPVRIKVAGIAQIMWILFYLHFPLSSTPLILQSVEKNRVGGNCIYL